MVEDGHHGAQNGHCPIRGAVGDWQDNETGYANEGGASGDGTGRPASGPAKMPANEKRSPPHDDDDDDHRQQLAWLNAVENFSPLWFAIPMNTGILAILMHQNPYQFRGLGTLSGIMYALDLVLSVAMAVVTCLRWTLRRKQAWRQTANIVDEIGYHAAPPIAFLTLTALTALVASNSSWGGRGWSLVAYVMFWVGFAWMTITCIGTSIMLFARDVCDEHGLTAAVFLPTVGVATAALTGGVICNYAYDVSARLAVPVILVSYMGVGLSIWHATILYALFFQRLMAVGYPPGPKRPSLIMACGPFGQSSAALVLLSSAAQVHTDFADYDKGTFLTKSAASGLGAASVMFALLTLGFDVFWLCCSVAGVVEGAVRGELCYTLAWWTSIFPVGTTALACITLSTATASPAFGYVATGILLVLWVNYIVNSGYTVWYSVYGELLIKDRGGENAKGRKRA